MPGREPMAPRMRDLNEASWWSVPSRKAYRRETSKSQSPIRSWSTCSPRKTVFSASHIRMVFAGCRASKKLQTMGGGKPRRNEVRARAYSVVKDVIERRVDGRPKHVESLDAFAEELHKLGYGAFRLWWTQTVAELRHGDAHSSPVSVSVLAAALVEGALTFVVKHARTAGLGVFQSKDFERDARTWKIDELVASAASGSDSAILDPQTKNRVETLIRNRQRIHAGRMLS